MSLQARHEMIPPSKKMPFSPLSIFLWPQLRGSSCGWGGITPLSAPQHRAGDSSLPALPMEVELGGQFLPKEGLPGVLPGTKSALYSRY